MTEYKLGVLFTLMMIWPIIVNSQPGTNFIYLGIDWKANDLDNTLFWIGLVIIIIFLAAAGYGDHRNAKKIEARDLR